MARVTPCGLAMSALDVLLGLLVMLAQRPAQSPPSPVVPSARFGRAMLFDSSLPGVFAKRDAVRRRQIFNAVCANLTVRDRRALYTAKEPWSIFENAGLIRSWCFRFSSNSRAWSPSSGKALCCAMGAGIDEATIQPLRTGGSFSCCA